MRKMKIMIVDDDKTTLDLLKICIETFCPDCQVIVADSGALALNMLRQLEEQRMVDLILTDYHMPGLNGLDLAKVVHQLLPDVRMVLISAEPESVELQREMEALKFEAYIPKPISMRQLLEVLDPQP